MTMAALALEMTDAGIQRMAEVLKEDPAGTGERVLTGGAAWVEEGK